MACRRTGPRDCQPCRSTVHAALQRPGPRSWSTPRDGPGVLQEAQVLVGDQLCGWVSKTSFPPRAVTRQAKARSSGHAGFIHADLTQVLARERMAQSSPPCRQLISPLCSHRGRVENLTNSLFARAVGPRLAPRTDPAHRRSAGRALLSKRAPHRPPSGFLLSRPCQKRR